MFQHNRNSRRLIQLQVQYSVIQHKSPPQNQLVIRHKLLLSHNRNQNLFPLLSQSHNLNSNKGELLI
jgi:hypothetical protein